jgi:hypothetical protein
MASEGLAPINGPAVLDLLQSEVNSGQAALDSLDRKMALIPVAIAGVAGLLLPQGDLAPYQFGLAIAAGAVSVVSVVLALIGLRGRPVSFGPESGWLAGQTASESGAFYEDVARRLNLSVLSLFEATKAKSRAFNLSIVAASCAMLLFLAVRVLPV